MQPHLFHLSVSLTVNFDWHDTVVAAQNSLEPNLTSASIVSRLIEWTFVLVSPSVWYYNYKSDNDYEWRSFNEEPSQRKTKFALNCILYWRFSQNLSRCRGRLGNILSRNLKTWEHCWMLANRPIVARVGKITIELVVKLKATRKEITPCHLLAIDNVVVGI